MLAALAYSCIRALEYCRAAEPRLSTDSEGIVLAISTKGRSDKLKLE